MAREEWAAVVEMAGEVRRMKLLCTLGRAAEVGHVMRCFSIEQ